MLIGVARPPPPELTHLLHLQQRLVRIDELQKRCRRHIIVPPQLREKVHSHLLHSDVKLRRDEHQALLDVVVHVQVVQEASGHRCQSVGWPGAEPVDGTAVHKRGELAQALAKGVADGGEADDDAKVLLALVDEKAVELLAGAVAANLEDRGTRKERSSATREEKKRGEKKRNGKKKKKKKKRKKARSGAGIMSLSNFYRRRHRPWLSASPFSPWAARSP